MSGMRARLVGSYGLIILLLAGSVGVGLRGVQSVLKNGTAVTEHTAPYLTHLSEAALLAKSAATDERGFLLTSDPKFITEFDAKVPKAQAALDAATAVASKEEQRSAVTGIKAGLSSWVDLVHSEFALHATNPAKALKLAMGEHRDARKLYETSITAAAKQASSALAVSVAARDAAAAQAKVVQIILLIIAVTTAVVVAARMSRRVTVPLGEVLRLLTAGAGGNLTGRATHKSRDEFGTVASALNTMLDSLTEVLTSIAGSATSLATSTDQFKGTSTRIAASAEESSVQATLVAAAAEQVSANVQTVAAGTEEMSASIREIAKNTNDAAGVAAQAVHVAETANVTVAKLGDSSAEIGAVIKVINSIAEQTNLLALNATIEAARAGESGKGFAVVASEVKELARETSNATEDIGRRIEAIQTDTQAAVAAISQIAGIIEQINDTQSTIASAVEEQTATTNEMGRNVSEAASGSNEIARNITGVAAAAAATTVGVGETLDLSAELARMSIELNDRVASFTY
jgi:methyl-accepting chemotaxis protein